MTHIRTQTVSGFDRNRLEHIAQWMQRDVDERRFPGSSVLITRGGEEVYFHATGKRDLETGLPFQRDTIVRIYSMTKPITSVALMMLVERGLVHLDAPIHEFLPAYQHMHALLPGAEHIEQVEACDPPSIHQLLTHTSGLSYSFNPGVLAAKMEAEEILFSSGQGKLAEMTDRLSQLPLAFKPGAQWEYSVGIDVVGRIIEVVSGKSLSEFFEEEIFAPLDMKDTGFSVPKTGKERFASLYTPLAENGLSFSGELAEDTLRLAESGETSIFHTTTLYSGGGGLVSTIDDYMRFAEMLRNGGSYREQRLLSPNTLAFMRRNHLPGDIASMGPESFAEQPMEGMGFGIGGAVVLNPARARVPGNVGDFSWGGMASTFFWTDPVADTCVVFFTQLAPSNSYPSRSKLKALVHAANLT